MLCGQHNTERPISRSRPDHSAAAHGTPTSVGQTHVSIGIHRVQAPPVTALDVRLNHAVAALRLVRCSDAWPRDWLPHPPPPILGQRREPNPSKSRRPHRAAPSPDRAGGGRHVARVSAGWPAPGASDGLARWARGHGSRNRGTGRPHRPRSAAAAAILRRARWPVAAVVEDQIQDHGHHLPSSGGHHVPGTGGGQSAAGRASRIVAISLRRALSRAISASISARRRDSSCSAGSQGH